MKPEMITLVISAIALLGAIFSAAWLNYNATMRVNQQLLEGMKFSNQQLLEGIKLALSQMEKRSDERSTAWKRN